MVGILSSHDEPFVIDNGPLAIDVGHKHSTSDDVTQDPGTKAWLRANSALDRILVLVVSPGGDDKIDSYQADVDKTSPVVFELGQSDDLMTLSWQKESNSTPTTLMIRAAKFAFERSSDKRRLKQPGSGGRKISKVSGGGLPAINIGNNAKVLVVLQAKELEHPHKA